MNDVAVHNTEKKPLMTFEICGKQYNLSEYETAIKENEIELSEYLTLLREFPYSVRNLRKEDKTKEIPINIIYDGEKLSIYEFFEKNREFEKEISNIDEINGLELKNEMSVKFTAFENDDDFYIVIINVFRVFQDLYNLFASARFALINAHRILHLRSAIEWKDGKEQLWLRSTWLNNAIIFYNSCFDRLMQAVWIGLELFDWQQTNKKKTLSKQDLLTNEGLEDIYSSFDYNKHKALIPDDLYGIIEPVYSQKLNVVRQYANSIKHRGGLRYRNVFTFGQIYDNWEGGAYSSFNTRNEKGMDDVVNSVKDYHIAFRELTKKVFHYVMNSFKEHGYMINGFDELKE